MKLTVRVAICGAKEARRDFVLSLMAALSNFLYVFLSILYKLTSLLPYQLQFQLQYFQQPDNKYKVVGGRQ